jgi:hypothetical protein
MKHIAWNCAYTVWSSAYIAWSCAYIAMASCLHANIAKRHHFALLNSTKSIFLMLLSVPLHWDQFLMKIYCDIMWYQWIILFVIVMSHMYQALWLHEIDFCADCVTLHVHYNGFVATTKEMCKQYLFNLC